MKKIALFIAVLFSAVIGIRFANAAPIYTFVGNTFPDQNNTRDLGTTSPAYQWNKIYTKTICVSGTCTSSLSGGGGGTGNVATSSSETAGFLPYWTSTGATPATLGKVATSAPTVSAPLQYSGTLGALVGGTSGAFSITQSGSGTNGYLSSTDWNTFNNKSGFAFPWTVTTDFGTTVNATTTPTWFQRGLFASSTTIFDNLLIGSSNNSGRLLPLTALQISSSTNNYIQGIIQNMSNGNNASSNWIACNDQDPTCNTYYAEFGINSSGYAQAAQSAENAGDSYLIASDGALVIGAASSTNSLAGIRFVTGGVSSSTIRATISNTGTTTVYGPLVVATTSQTALVATDQFRGTVFQLSTASSTPGAPVLQLGASSTVLFTFDNFGHSTASTTGRPSVSSCGTGATFSSDSNEDHGWITTGTGVPVMCTFTYQNPFLMRPGIIAMPTDFTPTAPLSASSTPTTASIMIPGGVSGGTIYYQIRGI